MTLPSVSDCIGDGPVRFDGLAEQGDVSGRIFDQCITAIESERNPCALVKPHVFMADF
jgi:hypothetical protein